MGTIKIIQYIFIGYACLVSSICLAISECFINRKVLRRCLIFALISLVLGVIVELMQIFTLERGMTLLIMSAPIIYIGFYQLLRKIFKSLTGFEPYQTSTKSVIGGKTSNKYHKNRTIKWTDFLFSFLQALLPIFTILGLMILILKQNR